MDREIQKKTYYEVDDHKFDTKEEAEEYVNFTPAECNIDVVMASSNRNWFDCQYSYSQKRKMAFQHLQEAREVVAKLTGPDMGFYNEL